MGFLTFKLFVSRIRKHFSYLSRECFMSKRSSFVLMVAYGTLKASLWLISEKQGLIAFHLRNPIIRTHLKQLFVLTIRGKFPESCHRKFWHGCGTFYKPAHITCTHKITKSFASSGEPPLQMKSNRMINDLEGRVMNLISAIWRLISMRCL